MAMTSPRPSGTLGAGALDGDTKGPDMLLPARATRATRGTRPTRATGATQAATQAAMPRTLAMSAVELATGVPAAGSTAQFTNRRDRTGMVARLAESLEQWRDRIDGVIRRSDLGEVALRDALGDRLAHLEVAWQVAHQRLWVSATTVGQDADSIHDDVEDALAEVKVAYAEVVAILGRR